MPTRLLTFLLILSVIGSGYVGVRAITRNPCEVPKTWSLGTVDKRFGLSEETVRSYAAEATETWNKEYAANPLFSYKESGGDITLSFVYDERQRTTIANERLKHTIEEEKAELSDIKETIESLRSQYESLENSIASRTASYNAKLSKHNKEVSYWNDRGGAPNDAYQRLQRESVELETERISLNASINRYNQLAEAIRNYGRDHNEIVGTINEKIGTLNETAMREFEEGTYDPNTETITIYEYGSVTALKRVLVHEFGHALSLDHVDDKNAIMYPVNQGKSVSLTDADKEELADVCREKTVEDLAQALRTIRDDIFLLVGWSSSDTAVQAR